MRATPILRLRRLLRLVPRLRPGTARVRHGQRWPDGGGVLAGGLFAGPGACRVSAHAHMAGATPGSPPSRASRSGMAMSARWPMVARS